MESWRRLGVGVSCRSGKNEKVRDWEELCTSVVMSGKGGLREGKWEGSSGPKGVAAGGRPLVNPVEFGGRNSKIGALYPGFSSDHINLSAFKIGAHP